MKKNKIEKDHFEKTKKNHKNKEKNHARKHCTQSIMF
jgi:hypothetical protein